MDILEEELIANKLIEYLKENTFDEPDIQFLKNFQMGNQEVDLAVIHNNRVITVFEIKLKLQPISTELYIEQILNRFSQVNAKSYVVSTEISNQGEHRLYFYTKINEKIIKTNIVQNQLLTKDQLKSKINATVINIEAIMNSLPNFKLAFSIKRIGFPENDFGQNLQCLYAINIIYNTVLENIQDINNISEMQEFLINDKLIPKLLGSMNNDNNNTAYIMGELLIPDYILLLYKFFASNILFSDVVLNNVLDKIKSKLSQDIDLMKMSPSSMLMNFLQQYKNIELEESRRELENTLNLETNNRGQHVMAQLYLSHKKDFKTNSDRWLIIILVTFFIGFIFYFFLYLTENFFYENFHPKFEKSSFFLFFPIFSASILYFTFLGFSIKQYVFSRKKLEEYSHKENVARLYMPLLNDISMSQNSDTLETLIRQKTYSLFIDDININQQECKSENLISKAIESFGKIKES